MVDSVSETMRISWDEVFEKNVLVFLNISCYIQDKNELERRRMNEYTKRKR